MRLALIEIPDNYDLDALPPGAILRGLFQKPTMYCKCEGKRKNSVAGRKYGWYVCPDCKRPRTNTVQRPANLVKRFVWPPRGTTVYYLAIDTCHARLVNGIPEEEPDAITIWREQYNAKQREESTSGGEGSTSSTT